MDVFLNDPITEKSSNHNSGNGLFYASSCMQGWKPEMEDSHCAVVGLPHNLEEWSFFGVFGGHRGNRASAYCSVNLMNAIIQEADLENCNKLSIPEEVDLVKKGIHDCFLKFDEGMKTIPEIATGEDRSGCTVICALISPTNYYLANCGNCRAIIARENKTFFETHDHKPSNLAEHERIVKAGGFVTNLRVNDVLPFSRALGDYEYKQVKYKEPCKQIISAEPEVWAKERSEFDEFLILASNGICNVISSNELCELIGHMLSSSNNLEFICSSIIDACFLKGSQNNMTIIIIVLPGAPKISKVAVENEKHLNTSLEQQVKEILEVRRNSDATDVLSILADEDIRELTPGGGLWFKKSFVEETIERLRDEIPETNPSTTGQPVNKNRNVQCLKHEVRKSLISNYLYYSTLYNPEKALLNHRGLDEWVSTNQLISVISGRVWLRHFESLTNGIRNPMEFEKFLTYLDLVAEEMAISTGLLFYNLAKLELVNKKIHNPNNNAYKQKLLQQSKVVKIKESDMHLLVVNEGHVDQ